MIRITAEGTIPEMRILPTLLKFKWCSHFSLSLFVLMLKSYDILCRVAAEAAVKAGVAAKIVYVIMYLHGGGGGNLP